MAGNHGRGRCRGVVQRSSPAHPSHDAVQQRGRVPSAVAVTHCRAGSARHEPAAAPAARVDGGGQQGRRVSGQGAARKWAAGRCPAA
ncbi:unnamed protein product [Miscanthus lutarioriparius]|uniref:Uncharacterized protein n=1 Tax=Miscanthus lutarioriparius TaxID=422564 RepID=A0A811PF39_9POAL|nr:unnamed protein product [Miscanthus lutarioriparius]